MALQDDCILWNKLGSNAEVTNSEIGSNFTIGGVPDYRPCKFGNGVRIDANTEVVSIANTPAQYDFAKGAIEMWCKCPYNIINGNHDSGTFVWSHFFAWYDTAPDSRSFTYLSPIPPSVGFTWEGKSNGAGFLWRQPLAGFNVLANTLFHLIFAWDRTHATKKRRLYLNGVEIGSDNLAFNDSDMTGATFYLGLQITSQAFGGIIDNVKWYNNCTDVTLAAIDANKDNEGWPVAGGGRLIDNKMINPLIDGGVMIG